MNIIKEHLIGMNSSQANIADKSIFHTISDSISKMSMTNLIQVLTLVVFALYVAQIHSFIEYSVKSFDSEMWVSCETTKGPFRFELRHDLAPNAVDYMLEALTTGYFEQQIPFVRVTKEVALFGITKQESRSRDKFIATRAGAKRDKNPHGEEDLTSRKMHPWPRGTIASIGGRLLLVVKKPNSKMGTSMHDAPLGFIEEKYMDVFDQLYMYNDIVNNKNGGGIEQPKVRREGMNYINREFPRSDILTSCTIESSKR